MKRLIPSLIICFLTFLFLPWLVTAQEKDPIDMARDYPPHLIDVDIALEQMQWRSKQLAETAKQLEMTLADNRARIAHLNDQVDELTQQLPIELRYANDDVRSKLVGDVLRELLAGRLEVASQEEAISQLTMALEKSEQEQSEVDELRKQKHQISIKASVKKLSAAKEGYDRAVQLAKNAAMSQHELAREKYVLELAEMELRHAELDYQLEQSSRTNEIANRLVEARISLQPAKARVAAAEKFLKLFSDSHDKIESISELRRNIEHLRENRQQAEQMIWQTKGQNFEINSLMKMTKSAAAASEAKEKPNQQK